MCTSTSVQHPSMFPNVHHIQCTRDVQEMYIASNEQVPELMQHMDEVIQTNCTPPHMYVTPNVCGSPRIPLAGERRIRRCSRPKPHADVPGDPKCTLPLTYTISDANNPQSTPPRVCTTPDVYRRLLLLQRAICPTQSDPQLDLQSDAQ